MEVEANFLGLANDVGQLLFITMIVNGMMALSYMSTTQRESLTTIISHLFILSLQNNILESVMPQEHNRHHTNPQPDKRRNNPRYSSSTNNSIGQEEKERERKEANEDPSGNLHDPAFSSVHHLVLEPVVDGVEIDRCVFQLQLAGQEIGLFAQEARGVDEVFCVLTCMT